MKSNFQRDPRTGKWFGTFERDPGVDGPFKPCPFCGEAEDFDVSGVSTTAHYSVRCGRCGAEAGSDDLPGATVPARALRSRATFEEVHRDGFERGVAAWNRRAATPEATS